MSTTALGPTISINLAETVLIEFAKARSKVVVPICFPLEFLGVQSCETFHFPLGIVNDASMMLSQGDLCNCSMAVTYTKGLKVEPTCLAPCLAWSYLKYLWLIPPTQALIYPV